MISTIDRYFTRYPSLSGLIYVAIVALFCLTTIFMLIDIVEQYEVRNSSLEVVSRLSGQDRLASSHGTVTESWPPGSPFLEGKTATLAGAALLQRLTGMISGAGGTIISSQIERQGALSKDSYVTAMATCELEQAALQKVLYDIEAGMPFLFVDRLIVQAQTALTESERVRVVIVASGQWLEAK
jgi:general secretion pathway protein M